MRAEVRIATVGKINPKKPKEEEEEGGDRPIDKERPSHSLLKGDYNLSTQL